jgi:MFS family permease
MKMRNIMEFFLNLVFFNIYKFDSLIHSLLNGINIFLLLGKIPFIKRKFEESGTTHQEVVNKLWTDRRYGFGIMLSGAGLSLFLFLFMFSVYLIIQEVFESHISLNWRYPFVLLMVLSYIVCYYTVFQGNKYLKWFKQFDNWSKKEKWKYAIYSIGSIFFVIALLIFSLRYLGSTTGSDIYSALIYSLPFLYPKDKNPYV